MRIIAKNVISRVGYFPGSIERTISFSLSLSGLEWSPSMPKQTSFLNREEMLSACSDLVDENCDESDRLSFLVSVTT